MTATQEEQSKTAKTATYDLVKGEFSQEEAFEIVNDLFAKKINFHESKSFSQVVRFGHSDPHELERITELRISREQACQMIANAKKNGKSIKVKSTISIELI